MPDAKIAVNIGKYMVLPERPAAPFVTSVNSHDGNEIPLVVTMLGQFMLAVVATLAIADGLENGL